VPILNEKEWDTPFECAACGTKFIPRPARAEAIAPPGDAPAPTTPLLDPEPVRPAPVGPVVVGILGGVALLVVLLLVAMSQSTGPTAQDGPDLPGKGRPRTDQDGGDPKEVGSDPYPECAAIRGWLRANLEGAEVVEWGERAFRPEGRPGDYTRTLVEVTYRSRNGRGNSVDRMTTFILWQGKVEAADDRRLRELQREWLSK
jgi:hypothetical protein